MRYLIIILFPFIAVSCGESKKETAPTSEEIPGNITVISDNSTIKDNVNQFIGYNITGEYMVKYAPDGDETPVTREIGANVVIRNHPYESIHKALLKKKLSKQFIVKCSACHDDYGNGVIGPSLLRKTADEVYDMIYKYKTDQTSNILMYRLVSKMDNEEIRFLAEDIAKFNEEVRNEAGE